MRGKSGEERCAVRGEIEEGEETGGKCKKRYKREERQTDQEKEGESRKFQGNEMNKKYKQMTESMYV